MFNKFIPFAHATSIFDIDVSFYKKNNIKTVLADLDNTLDSYRCYSPSIRVKELKDKLESNGINLMIISNNKGKRVKGYSELLGVEHLSSAHKPFKKRLLAYLKKHNLKKEDVVLIGDQLVTDVLLGRNAKIRVVLCEPIVKEDQWTTHFNRLIDRPIRKYLRKHNKFKGWSDMHE